MVCQNFKFLCRIHAQIDFRSLHGRMAEPKRHLSKVAGGFKDMYGAGMAQDMRSDMLAGYGWLDFLCSLNMPRQQVCKALTGHCPPSGIEKKMAVFDGGTDVEPINQRAVRVSAHSGRTRCRRPLPITRTASNAGCSMLSVVSSDTCTRLSRPDGSWYGRGPHRQF